MIDQVITIIINHNTKKLTKFCIETFLDTYPEFSLLLIDNRSSDIEYIERISIQNDNIACILNSTNLTHGPAMHQAMMATYQPFVLFLDSDCIVRKPGFIELMKDELMEKDAYAIGDIQQVDKDGINISTDKDFIEYVHPSVMMIDRKKYHLLPPFIAHGAPCIENMIQANKLNFGLLSFPTQNYIIHIGRGTREGVNIRWDGTKKNKKRLWFWRK